MKWHYFWVAVVKWDTWFISCSKSKSSAKTAIQSPPSFLLPNVLRATRDNDQARVSHWLLLLSLHCKSQQSHPGCWCKSQFSFLMGLFSFLWETVTDQAISCAQASAYSAISPALIFLDLDYCKYKANQRLFLKLFSSLTEGLPPHFSLMSEIKHNICIGEVVSLKMVNELMYFSNGEHEV